MDTILDKNSHRLNYSFEYYLMHHNELMALYNNKMRSIEGITAYDGNNSLYIDIIENEVIRLLSRDERSLSVVEKRLLKSARDFYTKYYNNIAGDFKLVSTYVSSKIFIKPYRDKLFDKTMCSSIVNYNNVLIKFVNQTYNNFCTGKSVDETALNIMFEYYSGKISTNMEQKYIDRCDFLVKYLLNSQNNYPVSGKNFLLQYFNYKKCMDEKKPLAKVYLSSKELGGDKLNPNTLGVSYGFTGIIFINESYAKLHPRQKRYHDIDNDFNLISTLFHELQHFTQSLEAESGRVSLTAMKMVKNHLFRTYLSTSQFNEYTENYDYRETEVEADMQGYLDAFKYARSFVPKRIKELTKTRARSDRMRSKSAFSFQFYENGLKTYIENYNVKMLNDIVKKRPYLINEFPQLKLFYNSNGDYIGFNNLISGYTRAQLNGMSEEYLGTYDEFFVIEFKDRLDNLNLNSFRNDDELFTVFYLVSNLFNDETKKLSRMISVCDNSKLDLFNKITNFRMQRITQYYNFLQDNMHIIESLVQRENNLKAQNRNRAVRTTSFMSSNYLNNQILYLRQLVSTNPVVSNTACATRLHNFNLRSVRNYG